MFNFFDVLSELIDYVVRYFKSVISLLDITKRSNDFMDNILNYVPDYFYTLVFSFIALMIILHLANRGS